MEISYSFFLFLYLLYIALFLVFSFFNLYHIYKYGFAGPWAYFITVGYIIATALALFVSYYFIAQIDWSRTFDLFELAKFRAPF